MRNGWYWDKSYINKTETEINNDRDNIFYGKLICVKLSNWEPTFLLRRKEDDGATITLPAYDSSEETYDTTITGYEFIGYTTQLYSSTYLLKTKNIPQNTIYLLASDKYVTDNWNDRTTKLWVINDNGEFAQVEEEDERESTTNYYRQNIGTEA